MTDATPRVVIRPDLARLAGVAADHFLNLAQQAMRERGQFCVALSGGSTPKALFDVLATPQLASAVPWASVHVFWSDERCVGPDDPQSNFRLAHDTLLQRVPIPAGNVHRILGEIANPAVAAQRYTSEIRDVLGKTGLPRFDLILLGLGEEGHTASIFPDVTVPEDGETLVAAIFVPKVNMWRITFTLPLINAARSVCFLVAGQAKAEVLRAVVTGPKSLRLPAQRVVPQHGELIIFADAAAASLVQ